MSLPPEYFRNNYGQCRLGDACHCVRNLASWMGTMCAQWMPTTATSFDELIAIARRERAAKRGNHDGRNDS